MKKILLLKDKEGASAEEFYQILLRYSKSKTIRCALYHVKELKIEEVVTSSVVICIRGDTPYMRYFIGKAKSMGKFVIYFLDDALKDMPDNSFRYPGRKKWHLECVKLCDVLLTTNRFIAEDYRKYIKNQRVALINTAVNGLMKNCDIGKHQRVKIVYAASEWHINNYNKMIAPIIDKLLEQYKDKIELYFVGFRPELKKSDIVHFVPKMSLADYQNYMENAGFDIGLAPLEDTYFSKRKYFNKFIEYTRYGICGIYSDVYPYKFVVRNAENGYLVENSPEKWLSSISLVIDQDTKRVECIANAQDYLIKNHNDSVIFSKLEEDIPEITYEINFSNGYFSDMQRLYKVLIYCPFFIREKLYMIRFSIKNEGFKSTIKRIRTKLS